MSAAAASGDAVAEVKNRKNFEPPDGGYGWIIVIAGIVINTSVNPLVQCFGVIFVNEFERMDISAAQTAFLLHLHFSIMCVASLLGSPLLKKYDFRRVSMLGAGLMCLGIFSTAFADDYATLLFTVSVLVGIGQGILTPALYVATNSYFKKRLTLAVCYSVSGTSLGPIFMPQVCNLLLNTYGLQGTILVLSAISLNAFAGCLLLRPAARKKSAEEGARESQQKDAAEQLISQVVYKETTVRRRSKAGFWAQLGDLFNIELLRDRPYLIVVVGLGVSSAAELNTILMVPFALADMSRFDRKEVGDFMSVLSAADVVGRLSLPILAHKSGFSPKVTYGMSLIGSVVAKTVLAIFYDERLLIVTSAIILGLSKGSKAVFQSILVPKYVALEKLAPATGLLMVFNGMVSLVLGPVLGFVHDFTDNYAYVFHSASLISLSCVALWMIEGLRAKKRLTRDQGV